MPEPEKPRTICVVSFYERDRSGEYCYNTVFVESDVAEIESKLEKSAYKKQENQRGDEIIWSVSSGMYSIGIKVSILYSMQGFTKKIHFT